MEREDAMTPDVPPLLRKMMSRQDLTREESAGLLEALLRHDAEGWRLLAFSVASQTKGETIDELLGMWDAMHRLTGDYPLDLAGRRPLEVSSSGGSGVRKINVSTLTALVAGEPEVPILKQSFWKLTGISGSADVLAALGIFAPSVTVPQIQRAVDEVGVAFYSPLFVSPELVNLVNFGRVLAEKQVGVNTPFNLLAPLYTPVPIVYRLFGINNAAQFGMLDRLFRGVGYRNALLIQGSDRLDEATVTGPSRLLGFRGGEDFALEITPESAGLKTAAPEEIAPADAYGSTRDFVRIVHGRETGPKRDLVALNAGLAFWISERADSIQDGVRRALDLLESGAVREKLRKLVELTGDPEVLRAAEREHLIP
jgi:anthranilate phosphoribosyltransferase